MSRTIAGFSPPAAHPNSLDQDHYVSWNNKQAKDYTTASWGDGSVHRANLLDDRVKKLVAVGGATRTKLVQAMADAALTDLRAEDVLPEILKVIGSSAVTDPTAAAAVGKLQAWVTDGARRTETSAGSKTYADADAIRIVDAWWPLLVEAEFEPGLGSGLYTAFGDKLPVDEAPSAGHGPRQDQLAEPAHLPAGGRVHLAPLRWSVRRVSGGLRRAPGDRPPGTPPAGG